MTSDTRRQTIILLAALGMMVSIVRVRPVASLPSWPALPERRPLTERQALARDMRIYELALFQGSTLSWQSYRSIQHTCDADTDDPLVVRACSIFYAAVDDHSDRHAIDDAVHLLTTGT